MELPTISVITPSYNQGRFIRQTVESVLSQHYPKVEYIVVDGLSTDSTLAILQEYTNQIQLIAERDNGQTDALNKGLRLATGDIICWLNSDDYFLPGTLQQVGEFFARHPHQVWLTADCLIVDERGKTIQEPIRYYKRLLRQLPASLYLGMTNAICQPATFWRRSTHEQLGYLDESLRYTMDYDWWLRLKSIQLPTVMKQSFTAFRIHSESKGGSQFIDQFDEDYSVLTRHESGKPIQLLHQLHNKLIISAYRLLK
ncbi:glycosyltransferase family 2 protein [Spirosoma sp. KUDC1026]|uniref:glycosyltransferase family 2 protein n=1 Tax=Spirosoma sp. KUDC1026 TaxID=2745947 RepID=UPI00159BDA60|nr:glycosyltransferase family 2 protein [Spirosoma sp. KUDC1026]QKZ11540.1 glycosyltransferase [Spirosoma sp. KUDC1026]